MFQGMFRKRGRPPDPPLQIGGYDKPSHEESKQIPVHQLRDAPRQLPLPAVREFEQSIVLQQEQPEISNAIVESSSLLQQHDVDMLDSHNRGLSQNPQQVMSPNQAIPNLVVEVDTPNVPDLPFSYEQRNEIFSETSSRMYRELCGPEGVVLQQNNILQQVIQQVHHDSNLHGAINEQQENISQIVAEVNRLREELARLKMALRQGFILIDETCAKHSTALEGLQSFAGAEIGANQKIHETLHRLSSQMGTLQHRTLELERNTSLDWRMQSIEDDLGKLQVKLLGNSQLSEPDKVVMQLSQQVRELSESPLWSEMKRTTEEVQHFKERISPVMKDIESRLKQLEVINQEQGNYQDMQKMKEKLSPVMIDIEKRLIALETRPVETSISNVSFTEENPTTMTTLIERVQVLESRVNNLEPSNSTLQSSISSTPLEPPEEHRRKESSVNEPSSSYTQERSAIPITHTYTMGELEGRILKRIQAIESQLTQYGAQELPHRQRELETKVNRLLQVSDLPSFGHESSSATSSIISLELRLKKMESSHESLVTENKKLQARVFALEESKTAMRVNHVIDRLDDVIKVVNTQATDSYHLDQSVQDIQQELMTLRQTVESWNDEQSNDENQEEQQEVSPQEDVPDLPVYEDQGHPYDPPPGLGRSPSNAGSGTTIILSSLELPLVKGSKRVFVRDAHLFAIGKYIVIDRWFVSKVIGRGSIFIDDPSPTDFPIGTSVRTIGPEDQWTVDENGRMHLNSIPTNMHSAQQADALRETEVFQTPPTTPRYKEVVEEDDGVIYLNRILPIDPTYQDSPDTLPSGKPKPPHDFDQETLDDETPLNQWLLDGSSRRSHQHWKQIYQYYKRNDPTPADLNGRDVILKQHNVLEVLKSAGALPKGEGPIVQVLDSIRRWEEQFLQVLRGLNLACSIYGKLLLNGVHSTLARLNKKKFAIEQIETKYKGSTLESQFYPELESHICTWLGHQLSDAVKRKANNRCATPSAGVMLTEYYFSVFPTPDVQAAQLSNYIRRPYNQATTASGVIQNLELWKVSIQIHREVAGLMLSLSDMRKAFFHIIQPVVHDELFDFALKMAREANLDARAISEEDTLLFFKRMVAKLHGVNINKEFSNPKKKQENTVKAITSGEATLPKGGGKSKGKGPALPKGNKGKGKGKRSDRSQTPPPSLGGKGGGESKKGNTKTKPAITQGKAGESVPKSIPPMGSTQASSSSSNPVTPSPKAGVSKPGKIPKQCAYFASPGGCTRGDKCMYLHEMEGGKPKPALPEDVAKLEARAKSNPSLRPPSKPPPKSSPSTPGIPIVKMLHVPRGPVSSFDFTMFYDCEEEGQYDQFFDCREPPELQHPISDTGDICPLPKTDPCRHMYRTFKTSRVSVMQHNRYAEWVRCHWCGHTHATMTYSSICCMHCRENTTP